MLINVLSLSGGMLGGSTKALYCEYMGFVLRVHGFCTASTWALYYRRGRQGPQSP